MDEKFKGQGPDGKPYNAQHIWLTMMVFINPVVASLPEHQHLFADHGCYVGRADNGDFLTRPCEASKGESELPKSFYPLEITETMDIDWLQKVNASITAAPAAAAATP